MAFEIEIKDGYDNSSYFYFCPVSVEKRSKIIWGEGMYFYHESVISIEEDDVGHFLAYFLLKYFDKELFFNKYRYSGGEGYITDFEWYVINNFYTYRAMSEMLKEIEKAAAMLANDYDNEALEPIKADFHISYMCEYEDPDRYRTDSKAAIREHIGVVIDFYDRFAARMRKMMTENPQTDLISINGP